jgi:hypothetical protein
MGNYTLDPICSFTDRHAPITALAAYDATTSWLIDMRGQNDKIIIVKNTGAAALTFTILGSVDSPDLGAYEWDKTILGDTIVAPAGISIQEFSAYWPYILVQVKGVGGIAVIKAAATSN